MGGVVLRSERLAGARFGSHEIVRLIGHGATATVFEARHVTLGKRVAIKLLHEHLASDEQIAARFLREGQIAARMRHPNVLDVIDVGREDGVPYLVMELLTGTDLRALLVDAAPLQVDHALAFLLPIASALAHAHEMGVLHRDLKPANIFLARDVRDDVVPKLVDFGLSKATGVDAAAALTEADAVAGTVLYMAPEQTLGMRNVSPASDQYSLAVVLYECLTGAPPFVTDGTVYDLIERIRNETPRPPSAARSGVPREVDAVVLRAMAREPSARYPSVRAFARDLLPFADDTTRRALRRDFRERTARKRHHHTTPAAGSAGATGAAAKRAPTRDSGPESATRPDLSGSGVSSRRSGGLVPPLPCAPGSSPFHLKGLYYRGLLFHADKTVGLGPFFDALSDEALRAFAQQSFLASAWYDVLPYVPLVATLAQQLGVRLDAFVRKTTAAQARYDAKHVYRRIFDATSPAAIADRIGRFNAQVSDFGTFDARVLEDERIALEYAEIPAYLAPWYGPMHLAYAEESMRLAGAFHVTVTSHVVVPAGERDGFPLVTFRSEVRWR